MNKQNLVPVSNLLSGFATLPEPKKGEKIETYAKRAYNSFDDFLQKQAEIIDEVADFVDTINKKGLYNAVSKVPIRRKIVAEFCKVNAPLEIQEPEEATTEEILEFNGLPKNLGEQMDDEQFQNLIKKLKTPKSDGITKTEAQKMREEHYGKFEPVMPSEKSYTHGNGGKTRKYHWESEIQDLFLSDHENFTNSLKIEDRFHTVESDESE